MVQMETHHINLYREKESSIIHHSYYQNFSFTWCFIVIAFLFFILLCFQKTAEKVYIFLIIIGTTVPTKQLHLHFNLKVRSVNKTFNYPQVKIFLWLHFDEPLLILIVIILLNFKTHFFGQHVILLIFILNNFHRSKLQKVGGLPIIIHLNK